MRRINNLHPSRLARSFEIRGASDVSSLIQHGLLARPGPEPPSARQVSAKLCFTMGVGYHIIVKLVASFAACFPKGKVGIMDSNLSRLEPVSKHNWVGYAVAVVAVVAIFPKQETAAC